MEPSTESEIRKALANITRQLIDEEDEAALVALFRQTKTLKAKLDAIAGRPALPPRKPREPSKKKRPISAAGILSRSLFLPGQGLVEDSSSDSTLPRRPKAKDVLNTLGNRNTTTSIRTDEMPAPPTHLPPPPPSAAAAASAAEDDGTGGAGAGEEAPAEEYYDEDEEEQEFFVCSDCGYEDYGETDERDGSFYCNNCWDLYAGIGDEGAGALPEEAEGGGDGGGGGDNEEEEGGTAPTPTEQPANVPGAAGGEAAADVAAATAKAAGGGDGGIQRSGNSIHDPTHPDYWKNLKQEIQLRKKEGPASSVKRKDIFSHFGVELVADDGGADGGGGAGAGEALDLDNVADTMLERIVEKRKSIRFMKKKKGKVKGEKKKEKKKKEKKETKKSKFLKKGKKKKMDPAALAELPAQGLLVKDPVGALPVRPPPAKAPPRKRKPAVPPPLFGRADRDGNVARDIFYWDHATGDEGVIAGAFAEPPGTAVDNWTAKGYPVRLDIVPFIMDEFGGLQEVNKLSESMSDWTTADGSPADEDYAGPSTAPPDY